MTKLRCNKRNTPTHDTHTLIHLTLAGSNKVTPQIIVCLIPTKAQRIVKDEGMNERLIELLSDLVALKLEMQRSTVNK